jgi:hypothetical protein
MEGFRFLEVLYDSAWGISQGGLGFWGGAYALIRALRTPYASWAAKRSVLHRIGAKHGPDLFYSPLGLPLAPAVVVFC